MLNALKKTRTLVLITIASGIALVSSGLADTRGDASLKEAKGIIKAFASSLKAELQAALNAGGPTNAIQVCKERAPAIAVDYSAQTGWDVGRTSLRLRNPSANAPDDWEKQVLLKFEERKAGGEDVKIMAFAEVTQVNGEKRFRYMQAIPTSELCLVCHGEVLAPDIGTALDEAYPEDQARGFSLGDIRGAFTLSKPL